MNDQTDLKALDEGRLDQLLRETMTGHRVEPKPSLWKDISRQLLWKELIHFNFTNLSPKFWMAGIAGLFLVATSLYYGFSVVAPENSPPKQRENISQVAFFAANPFSKPATGVLSYNSRKSTDNTIAANQPNKETIIEKISKPESGTKKQQIAYAQNIQKKSNRKLLTESLLLPTDFDELHSTGSDEISLFPNAGITRISPCKASLLIKSPEIDTIITISNVAGFLKFRKEAPATIRFVSANLGVIPEIAFYSDREAYSKTNFWLYAGITYHVSRFSISTGLGLGYVYDNGKYRVDYKSLDSVGYFTGVTSYSIGTNNEIIYNTNTIKVYDSLQHLGDFRTKNRYAYLQVPLLLGYRFFESNRVSLTFQAGPAISLLLGSRKSDPVIEYSNATISRIGNDTPSRIQTNWQIWANLYFEMRLNKKVSFYLEPSFKYYINPMITQENVIYKAPWTIGLGIGLQFNFGQKKTSP